jgi:hypothetical protein
MVAPSSLQLFWNLARSSRSRYSVTSSKSIPAAASWSREALEEAGNTPAATELLDIVLARGNGAAFQRSTYQDGGQLPAMVDRAAEATLR